MNYYPTKISDLSKIIYISRRMEHTAVIMMYWGLVNTYRV